MKIQKFLFDCLINGGAIEIQEQPGIKVISHTIGFVRGQNFGLVDF